MGCFACVLLIGKIESRRVNCMKKKKAGCPKTQPLGFILPLYFHSVRSKFKKPVISSKARISPNLAVA